ncbi:hypothetical protein [Olsenella intestinalis]|uniref:hypothetical protein n=1 Tax=Olsenella intestinalis TaxID=2930083 RepID=UPI00200CF90C|nr:hypothetical protein [Olsenella intestinalis]
MPTRSNLRQPNEVPSEEHIEELLQVLRDAYDGQIRPTKYTQLAKECESFKSVRAEIQRYAKSRGITPTELLLEKEILAPVSVPDRVPRPTQKVIDEWYEEIGADPTSNPFQRYPELTHLVFSFDANRSKYIHTPSEWGERERGIMDKNLEVLRTGDVLSCKAFLYRPVKEEREDVVATRLVGKGDKIQRNYYLQFGISCDDDAIDVPAEEFEFKSGSDYSKRIGTHRRKIDRKSYSAIDLLRFVSFPEACGVPEHGLQARITELNATYSVISTYAIEVRVAVDEALYRSRTASAEAFRSAVKDCRKKENGNMRGSRSQRLRPQTKASSQTIEEFAASLQTEVGEGVSVLRADVQLDCRGSDLDSPLYRRLKPNAKLSFKDLESLEEVCMGESVIGRVGEKYAVALLPFVKGDASPLADGTVHLFLLSAKGGVRKPNIVVSLLIAADPTSEMVKSRLTIDKDGTFKPRLKTINAEIEAQRRAATEAAEALAAEKRARNKPSPTEVREEDVELIDAKAGMFPLFKEVGGGNSMSAETRMAIERLQPGDPVILEPSPDLPNYSRKFASLASGLYSIPLQMVPYVSFENHHRIGYIAPKYGDQEPARELNEICQLSPYIQASVNEMVPVAKRARNAKSPKLTIRLDLDYDNLIFPEG